MAKFEIRQLQSDDFDDIMRLEDEVFAAAGEKVLGPYYVRVCCDFFQDVCFIARDEHGAAIGYLLSFVRDREAYCTTLAIVEAHQRSRAVSQLIRAFVQAIVTRVNTCWFTVNADNAAARALHKRLGARDVSVRRGFYGPNDERIVSVIDAEGFAKLRHRYERLGLVEKTAAQPMTRAMTRSTTQSESAMVVPPAFAQRTASGLAGAL